MTEGAADAKQIKYYRRLRRTVRIWAGGDESKANRYADYILASPDLFMLMVRLSRDDRVSRRSRGKLSGAILYFVNPLDFVPELVLGPPGLVDDVALAAYVLYELLETTDPSVVREHWEGSGDILELVRETLAVADAMLGGTVWRRLLARAESFFPSP